MRKYNMLCGNSKSLWHVWYNKDCHKLVLTNFVPNFFFSKLNKGWLSSVVWELWLQCWHYFKGQAHPKTINQTKSKPYIACLNKCIVHLEMCTSASGKRYTFKICIKKKQRDHPSRPTANEIDKVKIKHRTEETLSYKKVH